MSLAKYTREETLNLFEGNLQGKIYKLLPLFEGLDFTTKKVIIPKEKALSNYISYLSKLKLEIVGTFDSIDDGICNEKSKELRRIIMILKGLSDDDINHSVVRAGVLACLDLCDIIEHFIKKGSC